MNIIKMHSVIRELLDNETSPRYFPKTIDTAIVQAISSIVSDRYLNEKKRPRGSEPYSFQSSSKLRDELYTLIKTSPYIDASGNILPIADFPTDYNYLICVLANISGIEDYTEPITYAERSFINRDPKLRPTIISPSRIYSVESGDGVEVIWGPQGVLSKGKIVYLKKPADVSYGKEITLNSEIPQDSTIIAVTNIVLQTIRIIDEVVTAQDTILENNEFPIPINVGYKYQVSAGIAVNQFVNCDLPVNLHDEVCRRAAANISGIVENFDRKRDLNTEDLN